MSDPVNHPMSGWVVRDERPLEAATVASAATSQASLGELLTRLRAVRYVELPTPDGEGVAP